MNELTDVEKSIRSHDYLANKCDKKTTEGFVKFAYHKNVANMQRAQKRLLSRDEKINVWNEQYSFGKKYWKF